MVTSFISHPTRTAILYSAESDSEAIRRLFEPLLSSEHAEDYAFELTQDIAVMRSAIGAHVLHYKRLLKELSVASKRGDVDQFVCDRWQELTPELLAAGMMAFSGVVPGICGSAERLDSKEEVPHDRLLDVAKPFFADLQFRVWTTFVGSIPEHHTLESALAAHVQDNCALGDNASAFLRVTKILLQSEPADALASYAALATYATIVLHHKIENELEAAWARHYFLFETSRHTHTHISRWAVSQERAKMTIPEHAAWTALAELVPSALRIPLNAPVAHPLADPKAALDALESIALGLGYDGLFSHVLESMQLAADGESADEVLSMFRHALATWPRLKGLDDIPAIIGAFRDLILSQGNLQLVHEFFRYALDCVKRRDVQALVEARMGEFLKILGAPAGFLSHIGEAPREWEHSLPIRERADLWNERANALRLLGRSSDALALTEALLTETENKAELASSRRVLLRNRAILMRDLGATDRSLSELRELLRSCPFEERSQILYSLAMTCHELRRHSEALLLLKEAAGLPSNTTLRSRIHASMAGAYALNGDLDAARAALREPADTAIGAAIARASAYGQLVQEGVPLSNSENESLEDLMSQLWTASAALEECGNVNSADTVLALLVRLVCLREADQALELIHHHLAFQARHGVKPDPATIVRLATIRYEGGDHDAAMRLIESLPDLNVKHFGGIDDVYIGLDTTSNLDICLQRLMSVVASQEGQLSNLRLIAELRRDVLGRAKLTKAGQLPDGSATIRALGQHSSGLCAMAPSLGRLVVLEWSSIHGAPFALLTVLDESETDAPTLIVPGEVDLIRLRKRIANLLSVWHEHRDGDPFADPEWLKFEEWLHNAVSQFAHDGDHIVVINDTSLVGLPWHVALAPRWYCSYLPNWSTLLSTRPRSPSWDSMGVVSAPRSLDQPIVGATFDASIERSRDLAKRTGLNCRVFANEAADRQALKDVLAECDLVKVMCHGYASPKELEVAFMLSSDGRLAPMHASPKTDSDDPNLVSWREFQVLKKAAQVVVSAACSSGVLWQGGAGEQLGLYGALRNGGTLAVVAPRWAVPVQPTLAIIDDAIERHLVGRSSLIKALHEASVKAQQVMPRWLAWSIALEGDWQ